MYSINLEPWLNVLIIWWPCVGSFWFWLTVNIEIMIIILITHFIINKIKHVQVANIWSLLQRPLYLSKLYVTLQQNMTLAWFMTIQFRLRKKNIDFNNDGDFIKLRSWNFIFWVQTFSLCSIIDNWRISNRFAYKVISIMIKIVDARTMIPTKNGFMLVELLW